jgi:hypothetical protein
VGLRVFVPVSMCAYVCLCSVVVSIGRAGTQLFEGMKAYKDKQGRVRLFRPMLNMQRMWRSAERLALPVRKSE